MKNKIVGLAFATVGSAPALAAAAVHQIVASPPGPSIWAFIARLFGG